MKRQTILVVIVLMAVVPFASPSFAMGNGMGGHGMGRQDMMGSWGSALMDWWQKWQNRGEYTAPTDEQRSRMNAPERDYYKNSAALESAIEKKSKELDTVLNSPDPDIQRVRTLHNEIRDLRETLAKKQLDFERQAQQIDPQAEHGSNYNWQSYSPGGMGYSHGMGPGGRMDGYGSSR
jgi:Spy/CpxP family protein refolding chaperone